MATHSSNLALRIPIDRRVWWAVIHTIVKSQTQQFLLLALSPVFMSWVYSFHHILKGIQRFKNVKNSSFYSNEQKWEFNKCFLLVIITF